MTQKQKKAISKPAKPSKVKVVATPRARTRSIVKVLSESELQQKAYSLWESRGRPYGSPEIDWYDAKEQLRSQKQG